MVPIDHSAASVGPRRCNRHPLAGAGWECTECGELLCPDCVAISGKYGSVELLQCTGCGGIPRALTVHRNETPYPARVLSAWMYPLTKPGLLSLAMAGLVMAVAFGMPWFAPIGLCIFFAYFFGLIRQTASGSDDIEPPDVSRVGPDLIYPAGRGLVASSLLFLPAIAYLHYGRAWDTGGLLFDRALWVVLAISLFYIPMALLVAATGGGVLRLLNPIVVVGLAVQLGKDYALCVGALWALALLQAGVVALVAMSRALEIMLPFGVFAWTAMLYLPFVMARVLGLLLYTRGDEVGLGMPSDYRTRLAADRPRGTPRPEKDVRDRLDEFRGPEAAIGSTGAEGVASTPNAPRHAPIELEEPVAPLGFAPGQEPRRALKELDPAALPPLVTGDDEP